MTKKFTKYDPAAALVDDEEIAFFISEAVKTGDPSYVAQAIGVVARAKGMSEIAKETNLSREHLYRSLSEQGNPTMKTAMAVLDAMNLRITVEPKPQEVDSELDGEDREKQTGNVAIAIFSEHQYVLHPYTVTPALVISNPQIAVAQ